MKMTSAASRGRSPTGQCPAPVAGSAFRLPALAAEDGASPLLILQQAAGNGAAGRLLQTKLRVGPPSDAYEQEADRVADAVLREGSEPVPISEVRTTGAQRTCAKCQEEEETLQRKCHCQEEEDLVQPKTEGLAAPPTPAFETKIDSLRGSGRPLSNDLRSFFEPRFGHDFGAVRLHTGAAADEAARAVSARAFTVGNDVVFGSGEWSPETAAGKSLLAHELTHVVQQTPIARRKPLLQRAPQETGETAPATEESAPEPESPEPAPEPGPGEPSPEAASTDQAPAAALIVEDDATEVGEGQMKKSDFLARLRPEVCAAAEAGLAGTEHSAQGCPLIDFLFGYYEGQSAERFNRDLPRFAGDRPRPATAEEYIPLLTARVRQSVTAWARTGEITGLPRGIPLPGMGLLGGVFFKANPGGPRNPGSPQALRARLGAGRPLDGPVRSRMESAFGRGFSHVRVHTDSGAAGLATSLNAKAFTVGEHVAFGAREYRPGTLIGDGLIAHELAHVAQQDEATTAATGYEALERDADLAGAGAVASLWGGLRSLPRPEPRLRSGLRLQRCGGCGGKKASTTPLAATSSESACEPQPVSFETLQAEAHVAGIHTWGYTGLAPDSQHNCIPDFGPGTASGTCSFTPKPTGLKIISKYVKAGTYNDPQNRTQPVTQCGAVPVAYRVSDSLSDLAKEGEKEHCKDFQIAFNSTIKPCSEALARLAGTPLTGNNGEECLSDLSQKLGFNPRSCSQEFIRLYEMSLKRDDKDHQWHTFDIPSSPTTTDCQQVVYQIRKGKKNRIGDAAVKPEVYMPPATGCSGAASPSPPAGPAPAPPAPAAPQNPPLPGHTEATAADGGPGPADYVSPEPESPAREEPASEPAAAEDMPAPVVDDDARTVSPGQMKKSEFLARLRPAVHTAAAAAGLSDKSRAEQASSFVDLWLDQYEEKDAAEINGDLGKLVPGERRPATAEGLISAVAGKVRTGVASWERTGEVPPELSQLGGGSSLAGGLLGGVFFKAGPGGPRDPGDPAALQARLGAGRPLDGSVRSRMESAFGRGFSQVRVHADSGAAGLATSLNARAFTVGEHVAFGPREYRPGTVIGDALIAHELAHVVQQDGAGKEGGSAYGALEQDADRAAAGAVLSLWGGASAQARPEPRQRSRLRLSRCKRCGSDKSADCLPAVESFDAVKGSEPIMSMWYGKCRLALGTKEGSSGMSFAPTGTVPEGCSGELQFLQLIDTCRDRRTPSGDSERRKYGGYVLDTMDPYGVAPGSPSGRVPPGGRIEMYTNDNPGVDTPGFDQISADDKFKMWLLWKPDKPAGPPRIPLWMVEWSWKAKATRTGHSGDCAADWTLSGAAAEGGSGKPTSTMPAWSAVNTSFNWEKGSCGETEKKGGP